MKIQMSEMTGKLKDIQAINTNPLSNSWCIAMSSSPNKNIICTECYSCSMLKAYRRNCVPAFERNSVALSVAELKDDELPKLKANDIIRIHAHGELINKLHLLNLIKIVEKNPTKTFSLYTKRTDLINQVFATTATPQNLVLVYSQLIIDSPTNKIPPYFHKVFNVVKYTNLNKINCGANSCNTCRMCYDKTKDNIIYEKIK